MFASTLQCLGRECMWHPDPWHCKGEQCTWLSGGPTCCREILLKSPIIFRNLRVNCFCQLMFALFFFFWQIYAFSARHCCSHFPPGHVDNFLQATQVKRSCSIMVSPQVIPLILQGRGKCKYILRLETKMHVIFKRQMYFLATTQLL